MRGAEVQTARLILRRPVPSDAADIAAALGDWEVIQWLAQPPHPYRLEHAEAFLASDTARKVYAVTLNSEAGQGLAPLGGIISISPEGELGYWLARALHGQGVMGEAARALVDRHFEAGGGALRAFCQTGNLGSARILCGLGFRQVATDTSHSAIRGQAVERAEYLLSEADWAQARQARPTRPEGFDDPHPPIRSARLVLRDRLPEDYPAQLALASVYSIMKWTASWPWPVDPEFTRRRCDQPIPKELGRMCAIQCQGRVIGFVSVVRGELGYMIEEAFWGQGYASEAAGALIDERFAADPELDVIKAGVFDGNDASVKVLTKLGFVQTGRSEVFCRAQGKSLWGPEFTLTRVQREAARTTPTRNVQGN